MIGGAFLGGTGNGGNIPVGQCLLALQTMTQDRQGLTVTYTITDGTNTYTQVSDASGYAEKLVPSGATYTVSMTATGYDNTSPQTVVSASAESRYVRFELTRKIGYGSTLPATGKVGDIFFKFV